MRLFGKGKTVKRNRILKLLATVLAFVMLILPIVSCGDGQDEKESESETKKETLPFVPPPFADGVIEHEPTLDEVPSELGYSIIYDASRMSYKIGLCGLFLINSENKADIYFTNPSVNDVWLKLRIYSESDPKDIVCETGLIKPGELLKTVEFNRLLVDGEPIIVKVMSYDPSNYYSRGAFSMKPYVMNAKEE